MLMFYLKDWEEWAPWASLSYATGVDMYDMGLLRVISNLFTQLYWRLWLLIVRNKK